MSMEISLKSGGKIYNINLQLISKPCSFEREVHI